ncbi:hypothetical protein ES703_111437 [subsurface metagenome]
MQPGGTIPGALVVLTLMKQPRACIKLSPPATGARCPAVPQKSLTVSGAAPAPMSLPSGVWALSYIMVAPYQGMSINRIILPQLVEPRYMYMTMLPVFIMVALKQKTKVTMRLAAFPPEKP